MVLTMVQPLYQDITKLLQFIVYTHTTQDDKQVYQFQFSQTLFIRHRDNSYNSQKPDISYSDNWYKNETGHFVQKTFRTKLN